ncbi:DUF1294 domain-containing protein [Clostridiaceae bacterium M8S5]|nr:DUF1294 domain-containing protein [Clostridiaceae bacterium M8S5]
MDKYIEMLKYNIAGFSLAQYIFLIYLLLINLVCYCLMSYDKMNSKNKRQRIRESTFITLSILGGATGVLIGMVVFKHKTKKNKFRIGVPIIYIITRILETIILIYLIPSFA